MVNSQTQSKRLRLRHSLAALALGAMMAVSMTAPSLADPRHDGDHGDHGGPGRHDDRDWRGHEDRNWRDWHRPHSYAPPPRVVYAPPVVYAAPPPPEPWGINLILPLNFR
ncbi:MAG: hypothetical protein P4M15_06755 [Alphaproteobacteria bacterium]|nr:hypothetical protein [Alphaproteobacteria bacterium]